MKTIFVSFLLLLVLTSSNSYGQDKFAQIQNYDFALKSGKEDTVKTTIITPKPKPNKSFANVTGTSKEKKNVEEEALTKTSEVVLFRETFSNKSLDNRWLKNSDTKNMIGIETPDYGKVLKISNKVPRSSMIEIYLNDSIKGKKLKLECKIKTENIQQGREKIHIGQLAIEYQIGTEYVYPAVQGLVNDNDWETFYAREDGSMAEDDTDLGHFVFTIPKEAKRIRLYLGLQDCTGTIYFKDLVLTEVLE